MATCVLQCGQAERCYLTDFQVVGEVLVQWLAAAHSVTRLDRVRQLQSRLGVPVYLGEFVTPQIKSTMDERDVLRRVPVVLTTTTTKADEIRNKTHQIKSKSQYPKKRVNGRTQVQKMHQGGELVGHTTSRKNAPAERSDISGSVAKRNRKVSRVTCNHKAKRAAIMKHDCIMAGTKLTQPRKAMWCRDRCLCPQYKKPTLIAAPKDGLGNTSVKGK